MKRAHKKKKILILVIFTMIVLVVAVSLYVYDNTPNLAYGMYFSEDAMSWVWIQEGVAGYVEF